MTLRTVDCNGISVEMSEQAAQAFDALRRMRAKDEEEAKEENEKLRDRIKDLEEELAKSEAKKEDAEEEAKKAEDRANPVALDAMVRERIALVDSAKLLAPKLDVSKLDSAGIKREALRAAGVPIEGKSEHRLDADFEARVEIASRKADPMHRAAADLTGGRVQSQDAGEDARQRYLDRQKNAYQPKEAR